MPAYETPDDYIMLQRRTRHLEYCSADCTPEHKLLEPDRHKPADCLICGQPEPTGYVMVKGVDGKGNLGRVCSSHSLAEATLKSGDRWTVNLRFCDPDS